MASLLEKLRLLIGVGERSVREPPERVGYSYKVFWTKQARGWDVEQRRETLEAARALMASEAFEVNAFERRYRLPGREGEHSGASLLALVQVLEAFDGGE